MNSLEEDLDGLLSGSEGDGEDGDSGVGLILRCSVVGEDRVGCETHGGGR